MCLLILLVVFYIGHSAALTNVALGKPARQWPETVHNAWAGRAVDGNEATDFGLKSCTHTSPAVQRQPWWKVDLGRDYVIYKVAVKNRGDCCSYRLSNFDVRVVKEGGTDQLCFHQVEPVARGGWLNMTCRQPLIGQHVTVQIMAPSRLKSEQVLTLCEVQVWALQEKVETHSENEDPVTLKCPSTSDVYISRGWYAGLVLSSDEADPDSLLFSQQSSGSVVSDEVSQNLSLNPNTFELKISNIKFGETTYTCITKHAGEQEQVFPVQLRIYVQPKIQLQGLESTSFREFTTVTVTCYINRLYPAVDSNAFQMSWGNVSIDATRVKNKDSTFSYKVQMSQLVTRWNNGMKISCSVKPIFGNIVSVEKYIHVHDNHPEHRAILGLTGFTFVCMLFMVIIMVLLIVMFVRKRQQGIVNRESANRAPSEMGEKNVLYDINELTAELYEETGKVSVIQGQTSSRADPHHYEVLQSPSKKMENV